MKCSGIVISGQRGGTRIVGGCNAAPVEEIDGAWYCRNHAAETRYQLRQFESMMERATRHTKQIGIHGQGVRCLCGAFVPEGAEHPWGVAHGDEEAWWASHPGAVPGAWGTVER